jgi:RNA polymerase sigma-70 factor (ECF subfamily)
MWEEFIDRLGKFIGKYVSDKDDSEDLLQEVLIKIYKNLDNLEQEEKVYPWIYQIARNSIIDYYRRKNKMTSNLELEDIAVYDGEESSNEDIAICIKNMINSLPEKYKQVIILSEYENLTYKEISQRLGISISGVKSRIQRARKLLKNMLYDCCNLELDRLGNVIDFQHKTKDCKFC